MYEDFDPFANPERVQISVGRVESMPDNDPAEVLTVTLDGLAERIEGADLANIARPAGAEYRVSFHATRETRVTSWGAFGVGEFIEMHVSGALTDAAIRAALLYLVDKYVDSNRTLPPLTLESARNAALSGILAREPSLSKDRLVVLSEEDGEGGIYVFEVDGGEWLFTSTVERYKHLAIVTRLKKTRKDA